jgi:hypothetical protein
METIHGAPSHVLETDRVKLAVTATGGHLAPVTFRLDSRSVSPYAVAPWLPDQVGQDLPVLLTHLRGDFLCLPFGPQQDGPPHGETANHEWTLLERTENSLLLHMDPADTGACIKKAITTRPGETAIYQDHRIRKLAGEWSYGNHPILDLSHLPEGTGRVTVSPFRWASVYPGWFSAPADGASQALEPSAHFSDLRHVPLAAGGTTDLTHYPARPGNDDLVMMVNEPANADQPFAWSAVVLDGYVWFSLKNPEDFPATLFWLSNGGRSARPWNSRHTGRIGIEEVCSYFCDSVDLSRQNLLLELGIPTTRRFHPDEATSLRIIQAVAAVPADFGAVASIRPGGDARVVLTGDSGTSVTSPVDWKFVV